MNLYNAFIAGMRKGWQVATHNMLPNMVLAFGLIQLLEVSGLLALLGRVFAPLMRVFGLPGEAVTVLLTTWFSAGGGVGTAAGLYAQGRLSSSHLSILMPAIFLMGAQIQYLGRVLAAAGVSPKHYPVMCAFGLFNAAMAMLTMRWLIG